MKSTPVLRQFGDLRAADFDSDPVWVSVHTNDYDEPWYDDADEETFRPWTDELPISPENGMFLVRAKMKLSDGRNLGGFITPQHDGEPLNLGVVQPQLFLPSGKRCDFWDGMFKRDPDERKTIYSDLGSDPLKIFPIQFSADAKLATGQISGLIPGFCWRPNSEIQVYF
jgi:hypothetical protein